MTIVNLARHRSTFLNAERRPALRSQFRTFHQAPRTAPAGTARPIRVCFMIDELNRAGTETQLLALIRHLDRARILPFLCLLRGETESSRRLEPTDCPVLRLGVRSFRHPSTLLAAWRLGRFLHQMHIDVLQVYFPESTYLGVPVAWLAGVPHILRTRNNLGYAMTAWHHRLGRLCDRLTDGLVANSEACRRAVVAAENLSPSRIVVMENGVDLGRFPQSRLHTVRPPSQPRCIGVTANLRAVKGLDVFLRAAALVAAKQPNVSFAIAGEGPLRPALTQQARELGLEGRLAMPGSVKDIPTFLAGLDVAVLPSHSEGLSNALLEYMAAGKALVATAVGGNVQLVEDGRHGLLVPPGDPEKLAAAITRLLTDPVLAQRLGTAARRRTEERYSRQRMMQRFETLYLNLVG